ncbi:proline-rich protein 36-like [Enhydra lutris kenyoni]|uniref:Proline-rich protein 36-like n=1 Tax=Enhydra lutris kenyoni TaxID=391180 RepID=A0A2Y9JLD1_ENHLU|nr:proline-rich protein 36-like [Enhydra lutris kenyoni]
MISNPRAGRRFGEKLLLAASRGQAAAYLPAISSSPAASPSRASTATRPTQRGPARASERLGGRGRASRAVCALPTSQEVPGNIPSGPPLSASRQPPPPPPPPPLRVARSPGAAAPSPPRSLGRAAVASCCCCSSFWPTVA